MDFKKKFFVPEGHRILVGGGTTGTGCNGARALEGRRTEASVCRPSRARRVLAPIFRWFLHRLISPGASGADKRFLERYTLIVRPGSTYLAFLFSSFDSRFTSGGLSASDCPACSPSVTTT